MNKSSEKKGFDSFHSMNLDDGLLLW